MIFRTLWCIIRIYSTKGAFKINIGRKIKEARLAKGMTQEELGQFLGVQKSAIAKYESGRVVNIKRSTLKKISDLLNIPPTELIFDNPKTKQPTDDGELSEKRKALIDFAMSVPEDKAEMLLQVMKTILKGE